MTSVESSSVDDPVVRDQLIRQAARQIDRRASVVRGIRQVVVFVVFLVALAFLYTGYKWFGASVDHEQTEWWGIGSYLPRSDDLNMPPVLDILREFGSTPRGLDKPLGLFVLEEGLFTLRAAAVGFVIGAVIGLSIAVVLAWSHLLERAFLPYVVASQTIPIVAFAPIVVIWGERNFDFMPWEWQRWHSVAIIATYLTFFPVAVNGLRGLQAPRPADIELMSSYAATWRQTLWRVRLPASVPYLFAAFKIAATASVVGAIVGEISGGVNGGLGRRILLEAGRYSTGPERLYVAVIGAALLGIVVFLVITALERLMLARQGREAVA